MEIDKKFYNANYKRPVATTVGELAELLKELPDDLPIQGDFSDGIQLTVFNVSTINRVHLAFRDDE